MVRPARRPRFRLGIRGRGGVIVGRPSLALRHACVAVRLETDDRGARRRVVEARAPREARCERVALDRRALDETSPLVQRPGETILDLRRNLRASTLRVARHGDRHVEDRPGEPLGDLRLRDERRDRYRRIRARGGGRATGDRRARGPRRAVDLAGRAPDLGVERRLRTGIDPERRQLVGRVLPRAGHGALRRRARRREREQRVHRERRAEGSRDRAHHPRDSAKGRGHSIGHHGRGAEA